MLETSEELNQSNNIIQFPSPSASPNNIEEFKKIFVSNKIEVIDAFVDEVMSEVLRICYAYGYTGVSPKDVSYILISLKSAMLRHEGIYHEFQDRIDNFISENLSLLELEDDTETEDTE